jgi:hypothetical protein
MPTIGGKWILVQFKQFMGPPFGPGWKVVARPESMVFNYGLVIHLLGSLLYGTALVWPFVILIPHITIANLPIMAKHKDARAPKPFGVDTLTLWFPMQRG